MPYGREILLRNMKYALWRVDLFHFTENFSFLFQNYGVNYFTSSFKRDISLKKLICIYYERDSLFIICNIKIVGAQALNLFSMHIQKWKSNYIVIDKLLLF